MNDLQTKVLSLYYLHLFPLLLAVVFLLGTSGITLKIIAFLALGFVIVLLCSFTIKESGRTWQCFSRLLSRHFPPCFDHVLQCITIEIHLILVKAT